MPNLLIMRHGQCNADLEDHVEGRINSPLSEVGLEQARLAAKWMSAHYPSARIISSPLQQATETAEVIAQELGIKVEVDEDLTEMDSGVLNDLTRSDAAAKYPQFEGTRLLHESIEGGETMIEFRARVETFWSWLLSVTSLDERIIIVTHRSTISMLFRCFLRLPMDADVWLTTGDTGMHLWQVSDLRRRVMWTNKQEHFNL